jgi:peptidyl-Asp metalloendopeptidase
MTRFSTALTILLTLAIPAFAATERQILLKTSFAGATRKHERQPKPLRARFVEPDFAALAAPSLKKGEHLKIERKLTAALFDDKIVHIELDAVERDAIGASIWSGRIEGDEQSSVTMVVKDQALVATISTLTERFMIEPTETGEHEAFELDPAAFPDESEPIRTTPAARTLAANAAIVANDSAAIIDILVVYTDDLRASLGGTSAAQAAATSAIAAANTAYQNSGVTPRVRLAGTAEVSYAETGNSVTALTDLQGSSDGKMDEVHTLRNQLGADAVSMLVLNGGGTCGVAFVMTSPSANFASSAFSVVPNNCAVGNLSFPHEMGHNFGLEHDRFVANGSPAYPYGFGYVDTNHQFRDIMAYANACGSCPRIPYFSNPNLTYLNRPLGVSYESSPSTSADNVRALNNAASIIANWRQSVTGYTPTTFTDDPIVAGTTKVKALHITELRAAIDRYRASVSLGAVTWTPITSGTAIRASHITEMRTALKAAIPAAAFTDATLTTATKVKAVHIRDLRSYLD